MMCAPRRMEHDMPGHRELGRKNRAADGHRGTLEQTWKQRVFTCPDLVTVTLPGLHQAFGLCVLKRPNIAAIMEFEQCFDRRRMSAAKIFVGQPAENFHKIHNGGMAFDIERMIAGKRRLAEELTADEKRVRSRDGRMDRALRVLHGWSINTTALRRLNLHSVVT